MVESMVQMARRHVAEGEHRIAVHRASLDMLRQIGASTDLAEQLMIELETTQSLFCRDLARLEAERQD